MKRTRRSQEKRPGINLYIAENRGFFQFRAGFFIVFLFINGVCVYAQEVVTLVGHLNYAFSTDFSTDSKGNIIYSNSIGQDFSFVNPKINIINWAGVNYKFGNAHVLNLFYLVTPWPDKNSIIPSFLWSIYTWGIGVNISYNINENLFGIGPQIDLISIFLFIFKINITYRYTIHFTAENSHEIGFKIGIWDFPIK